MSAWTPRSRGRTSMRPGRGKRGSAGRTARRHIPVQVAVGGITIRARHSGGPLLRKSSHPAARSQLAIRARGQRMRWRAFPSYAELSRSPIAAPGTTSGNHRAHFPRHLRTSPGIVLAVQLDGLTLRAGMRSCAYFALQARGHWFEPSCAHQHKHLPSDHQAGPSCH